MFVGRQINRLPGQHMSAIIQELDAAISNKRMADITVESRIFRVFSVVRTPARATRYIMACVVA